MIQCRNLCHFKLSPLSFRAKSRNLHPMPKKENIQQMFDGIAPSYDRLNHIMSLGVDKLWRKRAVKEIIGTDDGVGDRRRHALKVLDIACGTGDSTIAIAKAGGAQTKVIGADISSGMMDFVMEKAARAGVTDRIKLMVADGTALPFEDCSFDVVTCSFGIRNFEDKAAGLREFFRVLKPGGKLVILELSVPSRPWLRKLYDIYFMHVMPLIGGMISGDKAAYKYLPASVHAFPAPEVFCAMMREAGFRDVRCRSFTFGLCRMFVGRKNS